MEYEIGLFVLGEAVSGNESSFAGFGWSDALKLSVNLGIVAVLFVITYRWILNNLTIKIDRIALDVSQIKSDTSKISQFAIELSQLQMQTSAGFKSVLGLESTLLSKIKAFENESNTEVTNILVQRWTPFIKGGRVFVTNECARKLIELALHRTMYDIIAHVSSEAMWTASETPQAEMEEKLFDRFMSSIRTSREFLSMFDTEKGNLSRALDEKLPIVTDASIGTVQFKKMVREVTTILYENKPNELKLSRLQVIASKRLQDTNRICLDYYQFESVR